MSSSIPRLLAVPMCGAASILLARLVRQSGFRKALGNPFDILTPIGLPAEVFIKRVRRIELLEFVPDAMSLIDFAEMTKSGGE